MSAKKQLNYQCYIFDRDEHTDDDSMGIIQGEISFEEDKTQKEWKPVMIAPGKTKPVSGDIQIQVFMTMKKLLSVRRGNSLLLPSHTSTHSTLGGHSNNILNVILDWKFEGNTSSSSRPGTNTGIDLDTSCVAVNSYGKILMDETVFFGDLVNSNRSIVHSGDVQGGGRGKGEIISCNLSKVRSHVKALYFILTVASPGKTFEDVQSASVKVVDGNIKCTLCQFQPSLVGDHTAMFLMRIARNVKGYSGWTLAIIDESDRIGTFLQFYIIQKIFFEQIVKLIPSSFTSFCNHSS